MLRANGRAEDSKRLRNISMGQEFDQGLRLSYFMFP